MANESATAAGNEGAGVRPVRVRYAPSPTGDPHVGNIRQAIWTWLYARHAGGKFIVRLEDTDQARAVPGSLERILESLNWLGVDWDEGPDIDGPYGPYVQSERLARYHEAADRLLAQGDAYRCFCSPEELDAMRKRQQAEKRPPGYEGRCRNIPPQDAARRASDGEPHVVRFKMPREGTTTVTDLLRGDVTVENRLLDDFVLLKSDRFPTYHLAHPVDDHAMEISHVTRGEEWLPSAPRHVRLFEALGYPQPVWVHMPVILGPDGGKLSKRHGAKNVLEYRAEGYLPEALFNFLVIIGWALDDHTELFTRERLIEVFDIAHVNSHPAVFDTQKLEWMNGVYIRQTAEDRLAELFAARLDAELPPEVPRPVDRGIVRAVTPLIRERVQTLAEVAPMVDFLFQREVPTPPTQDLLGKRWRDDPAGASRSLAASVEALEGLGTWETAAIEAALRSTAAALGAKPGELFTPIRLAVTGKPVTPPLFETMEIVGREASLERLRRAHEALEGARA